MRADASHTRQFCPGIPRRLLSNRQRDRTLHYLPPAILTIRKSKNRGPSLLQFCMLVWPSPAPISRSKVMDRSNSVVCARESVYRARKRESPFLASSIFVLRAAILRGHGMPSAIPIRVEYKRNCFHWLALGGPAGRFSNQYPATPIKSSTAKLQSIMVTARIGVSWFEGGKP